MIVSLAVATLLAAAAPLGPSPDALFAKADQAREAGRTDDAIALYTKGLKLKPSATESWWYLGLCQYDRNQFAKAANAFEKVVQAQPNKGASWAMLGVSLDGAKEYDRALAALRRAHALGIPAMNNLDRIARYQFAALLNRAGEFELSTAVLMSFAAASTVTPLVKQAAGLAALRLPLLPEDVPPDKAEPVRLAGETSVLVWKKHNAEAKQQASALLRAYPALPNAHYLMGYVLLQQNDPACLDAFRKEVELDPKHVPARLQIAYEYFRRSEPEKGLPWAQEAVRLAPGNFIAHNICGRILLALDKVSDAVRELEAAVKLEPGSPEAHFHLASAYSRLGRREEAAKHREVFAKLDKERKN